MRMDPWSRSIRSSRLPRRLSRRAVGVLACAILFVALAVLVARTDVLPFDLAITLAVQSVHSVWFVAPLAFLSAIGFPPLVDFISGSIILMLYGAGLKRQAVAAAFGALGIAGINFMAKAIVVRPRPSPDLVRVEHHIRNSGFPAGHVMTFTAFFGFLAYLAWTELAPSWRRTSLVTLLVASIALMGIARIEAGEHWASDVLGGYLSGAVWLAATVGFYARLQRRGERRAPLAPQGRVAEDSTARIGTETPPGTV
jgi:membrane-associated phospholipid phosphatase